MLSSTRHILHYVYKYNVLELSLYLDCNFVEHELENKFGRADYIFGIVTIPDTDVG